MADKRRRRQPDQADVNLRNHLDCLGIASVEAYQQWCAENGFSRRLKKTQADRRRERVAVQCCYSDREIRSRKRATLSQRETVKRILSGEITDVDVGAKVHQRLCAAVARLKLLNEDHFRSSLEALQLLFETAESKRAKFVGASHPESSQNQYRSCSYIESLASIAAFSHRWIRPPSTWKFRTHNQRRQFQSLISHLFEAHAAPSFFYASWFHNDFEEGLKEQSSFVHVAAGHSIRKTNLPISYTKRMSHHFLRAPSDCSFRQAIRWGQVLGLGGDGVLARAVVESPLGREFANEEFWETAIKWFVDHPMFDRNLFGVVYDYLQHQKFGQEEDVVRVEINGGRIQRSVERANQPNLSMKGRTPAALLREVNRWHRQLQDLVVRQSDCSWTHSGIRGLHMVEGENADSIWTIWELLGSNLLFKEGLAMNHCVSTYALSCKFRRTSIWTMRHTKSSVTERKLTLEVRLDSRAIVQARGKNNRMPKPNEIKILHRWAQSADLSLACRFS